MDEKRILLLEDEAEIAEILALALDGEGYLVDLVATVAEARARLGTLNYCLVIADLRLPDGDGLEIAEHAADLGAVTFEWLFVSAARHGIAARTPDEAAAPQRVGESRAAQDWQRAQRLAAEASGFNQASGKSERDAAGGARHDATQR